MFVVALATLLATTGAAPPRRPVEGAVRIGQTALVGGPKVTPIRVIEDSRCPATRVCVWAGRAVVRVRVTGGGWSRTMDLTLGQPAPVADGMMTLDRIEPALPPSGAVRAKDYRLTFRFQGGL